LNYRKPFTVSAMEWWKISSGLFGKYYIMCLRSNPNIIASHQLGSDINQRADDRRSYPKTIATPQLRAGTRGLRLWSLLVIPALVLLLAVACSSEHSAQEMESGKAGTEGTEVADSSTQTPPAADTGEAKQSSPSFPSAKADKPTDSNNAQTADQWAESVFNEALLKLANEDGFRFDPGAQGVLFLDGFDPNKGFAPRFKKAETIARIIDSQVSVNNQVIVAQYGPTISNISFWRFVVGGQQNVESDKPAYYYSQIEGIDPSRFSDNLDGCDTLIVYCGLQTIREQDFLNNGADRVSITTMVFVIDARNRELLHIEPIATNTPAATISSSYAYDVYGIAQTEQAYSYISTIMGSGQ
jgi:hypothetical protein